MAEPVAPDLRDFILQHIDSVTQLEALLLLRRAGGSAPLAAVAKGLYVSEPVAAEELAALRARGLVAADESGWRYAADDAAMKTMVDRLAETYARALIPVTNLVHGNPLRLRRFADAFKFRKDK